MHPQAAHIRTYTCASYHGLKKDGGPVQVIRAGLTNISGLFSNCNVGDIIEEMTLSKENAYHICDEATRKSGKLVKQIVIFDMANVGWIMPSSDLISSQNKASEIAKHLYPQLLEKVSLLFPVAFFLLLSSFTRFVKVVIMNAPWFFQQLWKIARMVLSESLTGKVSMCTGVIVPDGMSGKKKNQEIKFSFHHSSANKPVLGPVSTLIRPNNFHRLSAARVERLCRCLPSLYD